MIDWKEAARGIRKRERIRSAWWRAGWMDWQNAALYWMRRANAAEARLRELEPVLAAISSVNRQINERIPEPTFGPPKSV